jgi:hypothetical protein
MAEPPGTSHADLVALHRSTAMAPPGTEVAVGREQLLAVLVELLEARSLLTRLGADLRTVARRAGPGR